MYWTVLCIHVAQYKWLKTFILYDSTSGRKIPAFALKRHVEVFTRVQPVISCVSMTFPSERERISAFLEEESVVFTHCRDELHLWEAGVWERRGSSSSSRTLRTRVWQNHRQNATFIPRSSFWWRWERWTARPFSHHDCSPSCVLCVPLSFFSQHCDQPWWR